MSFRFYVMAFGLFVLLFVVKEMVLRKIFVEHLHLRMFEAAAGDLSLCADDEGCFKDAKRVKSWFSAAGVCNGTSKGKKPIDCFQGLSDEYSKEDQNQLNLALCSFIEFPSSVTRHALLRHAKYIDEDYLVEYGAYILALKGSEVSCEDSIRNYAGAYGPQWKYKWYRALAGCRILAKDSTREEEEKNFSLWFQGDCSKILNPDMRKACQTPGTTSPIPPYGKDQ